MVVLTVNMLQGKNKRKFWLRASVVPLLAAQFTLVAPSQTTDQDNKSPQERVATRKTASGNLAPDKWDVSILGGGSFFARTNKGLLTKFDEGGALGLRGAINPLDHLGLEFGYTYSVNNLTFGQGPILNTPAPSFGTRFHHWDLSGLFYFTSRESKFRPYAFIGVGAANFRPTGTAKDYARSVAFQPYNTRSLTISVNVMGDTGLGMKYFFVPHVGLQLEAR